MEVATNPKFVVSKVTYLPTLKFPFADSTVSKQLYTQTSIYQRPQSAIDKENFYEIFKTYCSYLYRYI